MYLLVYFIGSLLLIGGMLLIRSRLAVTLMIWLFLLLQGGLTLAAWWHKGLDQLQYFSFDPLGVLFVTVLALLAFSTVVHGFVNVKDNTTRRFMQYHAALTGLIMSVTAATLANNITVVWVFVEATTLMAAVLIYYEKNRLTLEAAWKYIFVCSTGIALAYFGILFLGFGMQHQARFDLSFSAMAAVVPRINPMYLKISFVFVLVGYATKLDLFPMHTAGVDAESVAQPQIGAFLSTAITNLGFVAFFRVYKMFWDTVIFNWMNHVLLLIGMLSVIVAAGYMLKARHAKRMLAYSTLENMGIVAIALGAGGYGYYAAIMILIVHSLIKGGLFFQLSQLYRNLRTYKLKETGHYFQVNPAGAVILLTGSLLILGLPPSGLFFPELLTFTALAMSKHWVILVLLFFFLCFVVYAFMTRILHMLFSPPIEDHPLPVVMKPNYAELSIQCGLLFLAMLLCFYQPAFLTSLIHQALQP